MGSADDGTWRPPVTFMEAQDLPQPMLDFFLTMDNLLSIMRQQWLDRKKKNG